MKMDSEDEADWTPEIPGLFTPRRLRSGGSSCSDDRDKELIRPAVALPVFKAPLNVPSSLDIVGGISAPTRPGISIEQFLQLVAECECGMVVSREVFHRHVCLLKERGGSKFSESYPFMYEEY